MLYREIIAVCSQIHTKHINTLCGQNVELLNVKLGTYSNHWISLSAALLHVLFSYRLHDQPEFSPSRRLLNNLVFSRPIERRCVRLWTYFAKFQDDII